MGQLLSVTTAGFEGSSTVCRAPSGAKGFEADLSLSHSQSDGSLPDSSCLGPLPDGALPAW